MVIKTHFVQNELKNVQKELKKFLFYVKGDLLVSLFLLKMSQRMFILS